MFRCNKINLENDVVFCSQQIFINSEFETPKKKKKIKQAKFNCTEFINMHHTGRTILESIKIK